MDGAAREGPNNLPVDLSTVLNGVAAKVDRRKLALLELRLKDALGVPLELQPVDDPMIIRRQLVDYMRRFGASPGVIHSFEHFFMAIIRRAALDDILPAPPEGPWTRPWQAILDAASLSRSTRAPLRSLAAWATKRNLNPRDIQDHHLIAWKDGLTVSDESLFAIRKALSCGIEAHIQPLGVSDTVLLHRLRSKHLRGTVKDNQGGNFSP